MSRKGRYPGFSVGDLEPPYVYQHTVEVRKRVGHRVVWFGDGARLACCRREMPGDMGTTLGTIATCFACVMCRGCAACNPHYISERTMQMGRWKSQNGDEMYPFQMDDYHLMHTRAKLRREEEGFKTNWYEWLEVLNCESQLRGLS